MRSVLGVHWKDWCWSWNSSTLATWCEQLTHWKRPWFWDGLGAEGEGDDRGWDGWMASPTQWTWVWINSGSWWWTGRPSVLQFMGSQRVGHDWATELTDWPTPVSWPREFHGLYSPWGHKESDTTKWLSLTSLTLVLWCCFSGSPWLTRYCISILKKYYLFSPRWSTDTCYNINLENIMLSERNKT